MANPNPCPATRFTVSSQPEDPLDKVPPLGQVKRMQRIIFKRATSDDEIDNRELAQLALAWERLEERKRVMVGRPAPKPMDMSDNGPRARKRKPIADAPAFEDPTDGPGTAKP